MESKIYDQTDYVMSQHLIQNCFYSMEKNNEKVAPVNTTQFFEVIVISVSVC